MSRSREGSVDSLYNQPNLNNDSQSGPGRLRLPVAQSTYKDGNQYATKAYHAPSSYKMGDSNIEYQMAGCISDAAPLSPGGRIRRSSADEAKRRHAQTRFRKASIDSSSSSVHRDIYSPIEASPVVPASMSGSSTRQTTRARRKGSEDGAVNWNGRADDEKMGDRPIPAGRSQRPAEIKFELLKSVLDECESFIPE